MANKGNSIPCSSQSRQSLSWKNCLLAKEKYNILAKDVWDFGKCTGLRNTGPEEEIIKRLQGMEERDRAATGKKGESVNDG